MTKFLVTYPNQQTAEIESSDCDTVEAFCNSHFGSSWDEAKEHGAKVEIAGAEAPQSDNDTEDSSEVATKPAAKKAKK
jgi:hypothetical protein